MKTCSKCKIAKEIKCFASRKEAKDGYSYSCKDCGREACRNFYNNNKEQQLERVRKYQEDNANLLKISRNKRKAIINEYQKNYKRERMKIDPLYRLSCNMRRTVSKIFRGKKFRKTEELLGCSFEQAKQHLESKFKEGMGWDNYGKWHIDHIFPLSRAENIEHLEKLCHFSNLQPLWAIDNITKSNKIDFTSNL